MNNTIIAAAISLVIGIGLGWAIKSSGLDPDPSGSAHTGRPNQRGLVPSGEPFPLEPSKSERKPDKPDAGNMPWNTPQPGEGTGAFGNILWSEPDPEAQRKAQEQREERMKRGHEERIADFARRLNLTPEQQDSLRTGHFAALLEQSRYFNTPGDKTGGPPEVPPLGRALGEILTEEQAAAYDVLRKKNTRAAAQSEALEELAELTFLHLTREQHDHIYEFMSRRLEAEMAEENQGGEDYSAVGGAVLGAAVGGAMSYGADSEPDPEEAARAEEARAAMTAKMIESRVSELQEFLTPEQVAQYRLQLQRSFQDDLIFYDPPNLYLPLLQR